MNLLERARTGLSRFQCAFGRRVETPGGAKLGEWCSALIAAPERWRGTHRLWVAAGIASAAFSLGMHGSTTLRLAPNAASDAALAELQRRVDDARSKASALPELQQAVQAQRLASGYAESTRPAAWQSIATVAAGSGMTLQSVEPGEHTAARHDAVRLVRIEARSTFTSFLAFLSALSSLPMLAVPVELKLEREEQGLLLQAVLAVHDTLPGVPLPPVDGPRAFGDPFVAPSTALLGPASELRLAGLMIEGARSLALIEADGQGAIYLPGQMLGRERVMRIGSASVTLAHETGTRVLTIGADS